MNLIISGNQYTWLVSYVCAFPDVSSPDGAFKKLKTEGESGPGLGGGHNPSTSCPTPARWELARPMSSLVIFSYWQLAQPMCSTFCLLCFSTVLPSPSLWPLSLTLPSCLSLSINNIILTVIIGVSFTRIIMITIVIFIILHIKLLQSYPSYNSNHCHHHHHTILTIFITTIIQF